MTTSNSMPSPSACRWLLAAGAWSLVHNAIGWWGARRYHHIDAGYNRINPVLLALTLGWLALGGQTRRTEIGWRGSSIQGWLVGLLAGLALGLPPLLAFRFPLGLQAGPIQFDLITRLSPGQFLRKTLVELPIVTAIWEELCFRGLLEAGLRRHFPTLPATLIATTAFTLGHGAVHHYSLAATNVAANQLPRPLAILGLMAAVFVGGLSFSALRHRFNSLGPAIVAHWLVDAIMLATFYWLGRRR